MKCVDDIRTLREQTGAYFSLLSQFSNEVLAFLPRLYFSAPPACFLTFLHCFDFPPAPIRQVASIFSAEQLATLQLALEDGEGSSAESVAFTDAPCASSSAGPIGSASGTGVATNATALSFLVDPVDMAL